MAKHTDIDPLSRRALILDMLQERSRGHDVRISVQTILARLEADWGKRGLPTTKTLHRDIKALQRELGTEVLAWHARNQSFELSRPVQHDEVELSFSAGFLSADQTAGYLFLVRQSLRQLEGTPLYRPEQKVFDALCGSGAPR